MYSQQPPLITVGVPAYNGQAFISQTLESVLCQDFSDFELLISDDCSTDDTEKICSSYIKKDSRIIYFRQERNVGASKNIETLISQAQGKYFMLLANDDYISPHTLSSLVSTVLKYSNITAAFGFAQYVDVYGNPINTVANNIQFKLNRSALHRRIKYIFMPHISGKMILLYSLFPLVSLRRALKNNVELTGYFSQDLDFIYYMLSHIEFNYSPNAVLYKRSHDCADSNKSFCAMAPSHQPILNIISRLFSRQNVFLRKLIIFFPGYHPRKLIFRPQGIELIVVILMYPLLAMLSLLYSIILVIRKRKNDFT